MKTVLMAAIVMLALAVGTVAEDSVQPGVWTQDFKAAKAVAKEKGLPLLLNFTGSDWCGWCKLMDKSVFSKPEWEDYASKNLMLVTLDFPRNKSKVPEAYVERNAKLQQQFGVRGYPTYILLDSDGETQIGRLGAGRGKTPESFSAEVEQLLQFTASSIAAFLDTLSAEDKAVYQAVLDEIDQTEDRIMAAKTLMTETREELESLSESVEELEAKAIAFRAEKEGAAEEVVEGEAEPADDEAGE